MLRLLISLTLAICWIGAGQARAGDPFAGADPYWSLLHEPAVRAELNFSSVQRQDFQKLIDKLDLLAFPVRNKSRDEALPAAAKIIAGAQRELKTVLEPPQEKRLREIVLWRLGADALLQDEVAERLQFTAAQRQRIKSLSEATQAALAALEKEGNAGKPRDGLEKKFNELQVDRQKQLAIVLKPEQRTALKTLLGPAFDLSKLGQPVYKAPELVNTGEWINSAPLRLDSLRGKVVVVHFYACGCINCIHNYPWYRQWSEGFKAKDFVLIGIHTPETSSERETANVRSKAAAEEFTFPILIDGKNENWNAWGNSMWPSVYLIDKRGYVRDFWPGELKWQGRDGEKYLREQIERLLVEPND